MPPRPATSSTRWPAKTSPGARSAIGFGIAPAARKPCIAWRVRTAVRRLCLLLLALCLAAPASALAAPEAGVNLALPFTARDLASVRDSGARTARFFVYTSQSPEEFDRPVAELTDSGVRPIFV